MLQTVPGRYGVAILVSGLGLGYLEALGSSDSFTLFGRYGFWLASCAAGWIQAMLIARGIRSLLEGLELSGWLLLLVSAFVLTFPLTFEIRWMWQMGTNNIGSVTSYWDSYLVILILNLSFSFIQFKFLEQWPLGRAKVKPLEAPIVQTTVSPPTSEHSDDFQKKDPTLSMLRKCPVGLQGELLAIQVEDHYLRIYTNKGSDLILGQMSGACHDLRGCAGMQVHRSWWVSIKAISELRKTGRNSELVLNNGLAVPVSRSKLQDLKACLNDK